MSDPEARRKILGTKFNSKSKEPLTMTENIKYAVPKKSSADFVDLVLQIMDTEGPRPMRNMKPAQKNRTGADLFYMEHHAEYEAMGRQSRDKMHGVKTHNLAYPKMYDELNRRRSTAKPQANHNLPPHYDSYCHICAKLMKKSRTDDRKHRAMSTKFKYSRHTKKSDLRDTKTRVSKLKKNYGGRRHYRTPSGIYKFSKIRLNKCCQCTTYIVPAQTRTVSTFNNGFTTQQTQLQDVLVDPASNNFENNENNTVVIVQKPTTEKSNKSKSDIDSNNPESTAPSISTYNSFMSMDHEPMVE